MMECSFWNFSNKSATKGQMFQDQSNGVSCQRMTILCKRGVCDDLVRNIRNEGLYVVSLANV